MPDIQMCPAQTCPVSRNCQRSPLSGTIPAYRQVWGGEPEVQGIMCGSYLPYMRKRYNTMRESLKWGLEWLVSLVLHSSPPRREGSYEEGYEEGYGFASRSLHAILGEGPFLIGTTEGELHVYYTSAHDDLDGLTGSYADGYCNAITALIVGTVSILESIPDERTRYINWQDVLAPFHTYDDKLPSIH